LGVALVAFNLLTAIRRSSLFILRMCTAQRKTSSIAMLVGAVPGAYLFDRMGASLMI
jgi:hypothetical protein